MSETGAASIGRLCSGALLLRRVAASPTLDGISHQSRPSGMAQQFPGEHEGCPLAGGLSPPLVGSTELLRYPHPPFIGQFRPFSVSYLRCRKAACIIQGCRRRLESEVVSEGYTG
jgi:hypothetical protein